MMNQKCETCGNIYESTFQVVMNGEWHEFDCFECAIHQLAPSCGHCGIRILGHGLQSGPALYCCAHCARQGGETELKDHVA